MLTLVPGRDLGPARGRTVAEDAAMPQRCMRRKWRASYHPIPRNIQPETCNGRLPLPHPTESRCECAMPSSRPDGGAVGLPIGTSPRPPQEQIRGHRQHLSSGVCLAHAAGGRLIRAATALQKGEDCPADLGWFFGGWPSQILQPVVTPATTTIYGRIAHPGSAASRFLRHATSTYGLAVGNAPGRRRHAGAGADGVRSRRRALRRGTDGRVAGLARDRAVPALVVPRLSPLPRLPRHRAAPIPAPRETGEGPRHPRARRLDDVSRHRHRQAVLGAGPQRARGRARRLGDREAAHVPPAVRHPQSRDRRLAAARVAGRPGRPRIPARRSRQAREARVPRVRIRGAARGGRGHRCGRGRRRQRLRRRSRRCADDAGVRGAGLEGVHRRARRMDPHRPAATQRGVARPDVCRRRRRQDRQRERRDGGGLDLGRRHGCQLLGVTTDAGECARRVEP